MSKYTLDEKIRFNNEVDDSFAKGYCLGVELYRGYVKASKEVKAATDQIAAASKILAVGKDGEPWNKGFLCGMRDAAKERKEQQGKRKRKPHSPW